MLPSTFIDLMFIGCYDYDLDVILNFKVASSRLFELNFDGPFDYA